MLLRQQLADLMLENALTPEQAEKGKIVVVSASSPSDQSAGAYVFGCDCTFEQFVAQRPNPLSEPVDGCVVLYTTVTGVPVYVGRLIVGKDWEYGWNLVESTITGSCLVIRHHPNLPPCANADRFVYLPSPQS